MKCPKNASEREFWDLYRQLKELNAQNRRLIQEIRDVRHQLGLLTDVEGLSTNREEREWPVDRHGDI